MYFAVGWPKYYGINDAPTGQPCGYKFNRDRSILAVLTEDRLTLWHYHVSMLFGITIMIRIILHPSRKWEGA